MLIINAIIEMYKYICIFMEIIDPGEDVPKYLKLTLNCVTIHKLIDTNMLKFFAINIDPDQLGLDKWQSSSHNNVTNLFPHN